MLLLSQQLPRLILRIVPRVVQVNDYRICTPENYKIIRTLTSTSNVTYNDRVIPLIQYGTHTTQLYSYTRTAAYEYRIAGIKAHSRYTGTSTSIILI